MKLLYIANQRLPTEKAYGLQIVKMCQAFVGLGLDVNLLAPTRVNPIRMDIFQYYSVGQNFQFKRVLAPDFYLPGRLDRLAFEVKMFFSGLILTLAVLRRKVDIIYSRDEWPLYFLSFFRRNLVFEAHKYSKSKTFFYVRFKHAKIKVVVVSHGLMKAFAAAGFKEEGLLVVPDGVDLKEFDINIDTLQARKKTGLPFDKRIVLYVGQLFAWKGADVLAEAASNLEEALLVFVGGSGEDLSRFRKKFSATKNVLILGQKLHQEIPYFLKAADVLVLPNKKDGQISEYYTSPLKLFEYMAAKKPIVASDLASLREILNNETAILVEANDSQALGRAIKRVLADAWLADKISKNAFARVQAYSWHWRAQTIYEKFFK